MNERWTDDGRVLAIALVALGAGISLARLERAARADGSLSEGQPGMYQGTPEAAWGKGRRFELELPWKVGPAVFEPRQGVESVGRIGYVSNIDYLGFASWMTIDDFLALNPPLDRGPRTAERVQWFDRHLRAGKPTGPPWLDLQATAFEDRQDMQDTPTAFRVMGHEGRTRMTALKGIVGGDAVLPVYCTVKGGHKARHLRHDALVGAILAHDPRSLAARRGRAPLSIERITLNGICY